MFRELRRKKQALSAEECATVLNNGTSGVLALSGDDGYPYAVPISYVYDGAKIYFHSAKVGHKLDAIQRNAKASFCVIDQDRVIPEEYATYFRSVIVFGQIRILENECEKRMAIEKLAVRYTPDDTQTGRQNVIDREWKSLCMLEMRIDHMTGKEAIELIKQKQQR
ncbi:MAG: pyridoxamine 5'-phosphate oxidase family protein [Gallicola sp.]|nr:pyridoxamine 5'-phosphate oxidase family protein [Gallicola sp.]